MPDKPDSFPPASIPDAADTLEDAVGHDIQDDDTDPADSEELTHTDEELLEMYPCLATIDRSDWAGIFLRAKREGVTVNELELRESDDPDTKPLTDNELVAKAANGILARSRREKRKPQDLDLRKNDPIREIFNAMYDLLKKANFPVKGEYEDEYGPVTRRPAANDDE